MTRAGLELLPAGQCVLQCPDARRAVHVACESMVAAGSAGSPSATLTSICSVVQSLLGRRLDVSAPEGYASEVPQSAGVGAPPLAPWLAPLTARRLQGDEAGLGGAGSVCSTDKDCTSTSCNSMRGAIYRAGLAPREQFLVFNPTHLNVTAEATMQLRDETGCELWPFTFEVSRLTLAGRSSEIVAIEIALSRLAAMAIFDAEQVRKLVCLFEDPATARTACSEPSNRVFLHVTLKAVVLGTPIDVPLPPISLEGILFSNSTGCTCLVGDEGTCKEDISALTVASLV